MAVLVYHLSNGTKVLKWQDLDRKILKIISGAKFEPKSGYTNYRIVIIGFSKGLLL